VGRGKILLEKDTSNRGLRRIIVQSFRRFARRFAEDANSGDANSTPTLFLHPVRSVSKPSRDITCAPHDHSLTSYMFNRSSHMMW
jgi:hypothetical protein